MLRTLSHLPDRSRDENCDYEMQNDYSQSFLGISNGTAARYARAIKKFHSNISFDKEKKQRCVPGSK